MVPGEHGHNDGQRDQLLVGQSKKSLWASISA
jgi:hypothetical protein